VNESEVRIGEVCSSVGQRQIRSEPFMKVNCDGEYYSASGKLVWRGALCCERLLEWLSLQPTGGCWSTRLHNTLHAVVISNGTAYREWNTLLWEHDALG
jgi:hypothetical protein